MVIFTVVASKWNRWGRRGASPDPPAPSSECTRPNINLTYSRTFVLYSLTRSFVRLVFIHPSNIYYFLLVSCFCHRWFKLTMSNYTTENEQPAIEERLRISIIVIYIVILVVSITANILIVLVLWRNFRRRRKTTRDKSFIVVTINQVLSHLVFVLVTIPVTLVKQSSPEWSFSTLWCKNMRPLPGSVLPPMMFSYVALAVYLWNRMR